MIAANYLARLVRSEDYDGHLGFTAMEWLAADFYWLAVRAGVAGRRAERGDVVAEPERERDAYAARHTALPNPYDDAGAAWIGRAAKWVRRGDQTLALTARRSR